ncbi:acylneuraminate cytidylyltransferase [Candidatus Kaiserbacteria bacterium CG10_big_fil_rev_8_21_14_0_10_59_10]|uniref:Acylneuraminate cytidylyltransferase n=1 Tax=Candidatus Kaiserbacteria bacterium CG10_big_fil_rev_8_21_14_0_10_59_10 TaxID=1974612 RepID=A0A2H0U7R9_9BACT|nr:MAG: acylneuraminate cytidylyltransferase [Candidatus Kaiserbacteria bacterium CG10_big_fil_rev_8_21_14_0_10_59_10]
MIAAIIQARMSSTRLPGKVLLPLAGYAALFHVVERVKRAPGIDSVIVATSVAPEDDEIVDFCTEHGYTHFRGSQDDVLSRYFEAAKTGPFDPVVRITSDCPLIDPSVLSELVQNFGAGRYDYQSNIAPNTRTFPRGLDCEIFSFAALERAHREAKNPYEREHVTPYIHENKKEDFVIGPQLVARDIYARPQFRLTLDYEEDYELLSHLYERFYEKKGDILHVPDVLAYLDAHPEMVSLNAFRDAEYPTKGIRA